MKPIYIPRDKCSFSTADVGAGQLLKTVLVFSAYLSGDRSAELVTVSASLSGEALCVTVCSARAVYTAVLLSGQLRVSFGTAALILPKLPASFFYPFAELEV